MAIQSNGGTKAYTPMQQPKDAKGNAGGDALKQIGDFAGSIWDKAKKALGK